MQNQVDTRVIVVWDSNGTYFQTWGGDGITHGIAIAHQIGGTYCIAIRPEQPDEATE